MSSSPTWQTLDNETLATFVKEGLRQARITGEAILELRKRFSDLPRKGTIDNCRTWTEFCKERLTVSDRQARRMIQSTGEENKAAKHDGSKNRQQQPPWSAKVKDGTLEEVARSVAQSGDPRRGRSGRNLLDQATVFHQPQRLENVRYFLR